MRNEWKIVPAREVLTGDTVSTATVLGRVTSVEDWESKVLIQIDGGRPLHVNPDTPVEVFR